MRGRWLLLSAAALILLGGAAAVLYLKGQKPEVRPVAASTPVFVPAEINLPGTVEASGFVPVAVPVEGTIEMLAVGAGQEVYEGQILGRVKNPGIDYAQRHAAESFERARERANSLDAAFVAARLEASRARADSSRIKSEYERVEKLYQRQQMLVREGATARLTYERAKKDFETAELQFNSLDQIAKQAEERAAALQMDIDKARRAQEEAERELEQAKESVAAAEIHSPVNGLVLAIAKKEGEEVTPEIKDLFRIAVNLTLLEAVVQPEPPALQRVRSGQEALISIAELPDPIPGRVKEVRNGSQVVVEFANPSPVIRPGLTVQVRIKLL